VIHFLDASALVKRYVREPGSEAVASLFRRARTLTLSRLSVAEVPAALARRARRKDLNEELARGAADRFQSDIADFGVVEVRPRVLLRAAELVWQADLRAYDAVQLASAIELSKQVSALVTFVGADAALLRAAQAMGIRALGVG
jgi:predicted nucleic acid-binding protein